MSKKPQVMLAVIVSFLAALPEVASACGPRTFPKVECNGATARLCTSRRNSLAWEWITVRGAEANALCRDEGGGGSNDADTSAADGAEGADAAPEEPQ
jgi:hypothetical protein